MSGDRMIVYMVARDELHIADLSGIGLSEVPTLGRYRFARARRGLDRHVHRGAFEICFLIEGRQVYRAGGRDWLLGAGDAFRTLPDEPHGSGERPQEIGALRWLQVVPPRRGRGFLGLDATASAELARRLAALPRVFPAPPRVVERFDAAFAAVAAGDRTAAGAVLAELLLATCAAAAAPRPAAETGMQPVLRFVEDNLHRPLGARELARRAGLALAWFKTRFRAEVGQPPARYVMRRRIDRAVELLASGRPVTRVAQDLGFASSQHFATVVRRFTGRTPVSFRCRRQR